jgi:hypothetical protein
VAQWAGPVRPEVPKVWKTTLFSLGPAWLTLGLRRLSWAEAHEVLCEKVQVCALNSSRLIWFPGSGILCGFVWLCACGLVCVWRHSGEKGRTKGVSRNARKEAEARQELAGGAVWLRRWWHDGHRCGGSLADQGLCEAVKAKRQRHEVVRRCDESRGCAARMHAASRGSAEQG